MENFHEKDVKEIIDCTIKYCWALDKKDWKSLSQVFISDAYAKYGLTEHRGIESIVDKCKKSLTPLDASHHMVSNHVVAIDGDNATCMCYFQAQHVRESASGGSNFIIAGTYEDELLRVNGNWKITSRVLTKVWTEGNAKEVNP